MEVTLSSIRRPTPISDALVSKIDALLPQTQCERCGFPGCRPYAAAIAANESAINRCPPGGEQTIAALAELLGRAIVDLDPEVGEATRFDVAWIDETWCIGCTLCIQACPVDAIVGAAKRMHTVLPSDCTGCALCLAPCPVDCIEMRPPSPDYPDWAAWMSTQAPVARVRFEQRGLRLEEIQRQRKAKREVRQQTLSRQTSVESKQSAILAAVARVRDRRNSAG